MKVNYCRVVIFYMKPILTLNNWETKDILYCDNSNNIIIQKAEIVRLDLEVRPNAC